MPTMNQEQFAISGWALNNYISVEQNTTRKLLPSMLKTIAGSKGGERYHRSKHLDSGNSVLHLNIEKSNFRFYIILSILIT